MNAHPHISSSRLEVMNFLNDMTMNFPQAVSFASGRPTEKFFALSEMMASLETYVSHTSQAFRIDRSEARNRIAQYGRTSGVIGEQVARQLGIDEDLACSGDQIFLTSGCQEAIDFTVTSLCGADGTLLVRSPCYVGATGVAELNGIEVAAFNCDEDARVPGALTDLLDTLQARGKLPRVLYLTPEFDNPTGEVMSIATRLEVIRLCADRGVVILEDNPYGMFRYEGEQSPSMFSLDDRGTVIYLGTYSKTLCPSLRIGFAVLPRKLGGSERATAELMELLGQRKSYSTVNTSQVGQAIVAGVLIEESFSLSRYAEKAREYYRGNRDALLESLSVYFRDLAGQVSWNAPAGGFFLIVNLPFKFGAEEANECAAHFGALVMPLSFFAMDNAQDRRVRLSFSNLTPERIRIGISRFADFVRTRIPR